MSEKGYEYPVFKFAKWTKDECWHFLKWVGFALWKKTEKIANSTKKNSFFANWKKKLNEYYGRSHEPSRSWANKFACLGTRSWYSGCPWAACDSGFHRQMQKSNRESHTRSGKAVGRQRRHEVLQKVRDIRWRKTIATLIESFLSFSVKALSMAVRIKDSDALHNELKNNNIVTKELSDLSGGIALRCGCLLAVGSDNCKTCRFQQRWRALLPFSWCRWLSTCWGRWSTNC